VAAAALIAVLALAALVLPHGELRCLAVVDSSSTFSIESITPGRLQCSLRDGSAAGGQALVNERVLTFDRNDLVELALAPDLSPGAAVVAGQVLATVRSLHTEHRLDGLRARRNALQAHRALLLAGGAPESVSEAEQAVILAEAERSAGQAELSRVRLLAAQGLASAEELEVAELEDQVRSARVALARAGVEVAEGPVRPETLAEIDSRLAAAESAISELGRLQHEERILSPIDGVADVPADGTGVRVHNLDPAYLEIPIAAASRSRVEVGTEVLLTISPTEIFSGRISDIATTTTELRGEAIYWASASVNDPNRLLRLGTTGTACIALDGEGFGLLARLRHRMGRP